MNDIFTKYQDDITEVRPENITVRVWQRTK